MLHMVRNISVFAVALVLAALFAPSAYAADVEQLSVNYQIAVQAYEDAVVERSQNADEIAGIEADIVQIDGELGEARANLEETVVTLYKESNAHDEMIDILFSSTSFTEAITRYDTYMRVQNYYADQARQFSAHHDELLARRDELEARKLELESRVSEAKQAADDAETALLRAMNVEGSDYHQMQGNSSNCGATAFTVGVNILLAEERFPDNVKVWEGAGFQKDSTNALALRGRAWLLANELGDKIAIEEVPGDIHTTDELREQLEQGRLVIISSGAKSIWQRADGSETEPGAFPAGHWIIFYRYDDGAFFANDSSVSADKGAGVRYDEEQMQQWLDGRAYHFATVMYEK